MRFNPTIVQAVGSKRKKIFRIGKLSTKSRGFRSFGVGRCRSTTEHAAGRFVAAGILFGSPQTRYASTMRTDFSPGSAAASTVQLPPVATLILISAVSPLAINIFLPSMPRMAEHFSTSYATIQLGLSLYLAMTAILQLIVGPVSDFLGRRPVLIASLILFLLGVLLSLYAPTVELFLAGRAIQAASAAGIVLSRAIVRDVYPQDRSASMIGYVTMGMAVAPMIGPAIGGVLDDMFGWRASFWILFGLGVAALVATFISLPETNQGRGAPVGVQLKSYGALFDSGSFWLFTLAATLASAVFFAFIGGAPQLASSTLGMSATAYGLWFALCALGYMVGNFISGRYSVRFGVRTMILCGAVLTLTGATMTGIAYLAGMFGPLALFAPMLAVGIGNGMTLPNATAGAVSVRPEAAGAAAGMLASFQIAVGAAASVGAGVLVSGSNGIAGYCTLLAAFGLAGMLFAWLANRHAG